MEQPRNPRAARLALIGTTLLIGLATLRPAPAEVANVARTAWWQVGAGEIGLADLIQNLLLFLPLGAAARAAGWTARRTALVACLGSIAIELTQAIALPGRDAALGDVLANTLGGAMGWWLAGRPWIWLRHPSGTPARRAAVALVTAWLMIGLAGSWLLQTVPVKPPVAVLGGAGLDRVRAWPAPVASTVPRATARGERWLVATEWRDGAIPDETPGLAQLRDGTGRIVAGTSMGEDGIRAAVPTRAAAWRLRSPMLEVPFAGRPTDGDPIRVGIWWHARGRQLTVSTPAGEAALAVALGPQHAWLLLHPFAQTLRDDRATEWWTVAWLATWAALLGWLTASQPRALAWLATAALVSGGSAALAGVLLTPMEWGGVLAGWLVAWWAGRGRGAIPVETTPRRDP